jgi:glycerol-3-phosphate cytidylyltransferase
MGNFLKTVITFGTYDLLHVGHIRILQRAKQLGDRLVVGVSTDALNWSKKARRTVYSEADRMEIVRAVAGVDEVFYEHALELKGEYIKQYGADLLVMGDDWAGRFDEFKSLCEVVYLPRTEGISTTDTLSGIRSKPIAQVAAAR